MKYIIYIVLICILSFIQISCSVNVKKVSEESDFIGKQINPNCEIIDISYDSTVLNEFANKLIFYLPTTGCISCNLNQLVVINEIESIIDSNNLIIISDFRSYKDLLIFRQANPFVFKTYKISQNIFNGEVKDYTNSFCFMFNKDAKVEYFIKCDEVVREKTKNAILSLIKQQLEKPKQN